MEPKKTIVLGASLNPQRTSYLAVKSLQHHGHDVLAFGITEGMIGNVPVISEPEWEDDVHTVSLYLNPKNQHGYYDKILSSNVKRVIFNPGTYNAAFIDLLEKKGKEVIEACTLVMLASRLY